MALRALTRAVVVVFVGRLFSNVMGLQMHSEATMAREIFGGTVVPDAAAKFTVGLRKTRTSINMCGGSLIAPQFVLTAAHCLGSYQYVSIGSMNNSGATSGQQLFIAAKYKHPAYNPYTMSNDIGLVKLETPVSLPITPVVLSNVDAYEAVGTWSMVKGWGYEENGLKSPVLKEVEIQIQDLESCAQVIKDTDPDNVYEVGDWTICAGGRGGEDSCGGDSGGPLTVVNGTTEVQIGVVSWGVSCGIPRVPGVYARIRPAREFIDSISVGHTWDD